MRLRAAYGFLKLDLRTDAFQDLDPDFAEEVQYLATGDNGSSPKHQAFIWASFEPSENWEVGGIVRYVDPLPAVHTDRYLEFDLRLGWRPHPRFETSLVGQNLLASHHREFEASLVSTMPTEIQRSVYVAMAYRF